MEQFRLATINTGKAVHIAKYHKGKSVDGYDVYCGAGKTGVRPRLFFTGQEVKVENVTCKKCLARYGDQLHVEEQEEKELSMEEIKAELKRMKENKISVTLG
jgi:hypothetical protein